MFGSTELFLSFQALADVVEALLGAVFIDSKGDLG